MLRASLTVSVVVSPALIVGGRRRILSLSCGLHARALVPTLPQPQALWRHAEVTGVAVGVPARVGAGLGVLAEPEGSGVESGGLVGPAVLDGLVTFRV